MSDIRDRIAAVIENHHQADEWGYDIEECRCGERFRGNWSEHLADVLIRELGLHQEWRADLGDDVQDGEQAMVLHRYTTAWTADE